jgi:hypothetical protein
MRIGGTGGDENTGDVGAMGGIESIQLYWM